MARCESLETITGLIARNDQASVAGSKPAGIAFYLFIHVFPSKSPRHALVNLYAIDAKSTLLEVLL